MGMAPELDPKWWSKKRPLLLKSTGFGKQLKAYQDAVAAYEDAKTAKAGEEAYWAAEKLITETLPAAAQTAIKACGTSYKDAVTTLKAYVSTVFPKEATRIESLYKSRAELEQKAEAGDFKKVDGIVTAIATLADEAVVKQGKIREALGGVDKAKQMALTARKAKDEAGTKAAAGVARKAMEAAATRYGELQGLLQRAQDHVKSFDLYYDKGSDLYGTRVNQACQTGDTHKNRIVAIARDMGYEVQDAQKAENELLKIIQGGMDDVTALTTTVASVCERYEMSRSTVVGRLGQIGGKLGSWGIDLSNAESTNDPTTVKEVATKIAATLPALAQLAQKVGGEAAKAAKSFRDEVNPMAKELLKYPSVPPRVKERLAGAVEGANGIDKQVKALLTDVIKLQDKIKKLVG